MERLIFGAVADDDTGASDLAGMLAERGVQTLQVIDLPDEAQFMEWSRGYQAVVMAEGTRNLPPEQGASARHTTKQCERRRLPDRRGQLLTSHSATKCPVSGAGRRGVAN